MEKIKIALLLGGVSGEREVSLKTGEKIFQALDKEKYEIEKYDPKADLKELIDDIIAEKIDLVFPALHGPFGEDGKLQGMLDMLGVPYVFSGCLSSALAMNKHKTKLIAKDAGVPTADCQIVSKDEKFDLEEIGDKFSFPVVVKPIELGSSVGISIVKSKEELEKAIEEAFSYGSSVLLEKFIKGRELTVAVMGNNPPEALPVIEIKPKSSEWFDYKAKYEPGATEEICPAQIPDDIKMQVQNLAVKVYNAIGCKDLARADFIWDEKEKKLYFLEINTIPGMTATSLAPQAAKAAGMEFPQFLDNLVEMALDARKKN